MLPWNQQSLSKYISNWKHGYFAEFSIKKCLKMRIFRLLSLFVKKIFVFALLYNEPTNMLPWNHQSLSKYITNWKYGYFAEFWIKKCLKFENFAAPLPFCKKNHLFLHFSTMNPPICFHKTINRYLNISQAENTVIWPNFGSKSA